MAGCFGCNGCFSGLRSESRWGHAGKWPQLQGTYTKETCPGEPRCKVAHVEQQTDEAVAILLEVEERELHRLATEAEAMQHRKSEETLKSAMDLEDEALREMQEAIGFLKDLEKHDLDKPMAARVEAGFEEAPTLAEEDDKFYNALRQSEAHLDSCPNATFKLSVELAPEGDKDLFEVHMTMTICDFKELLRQHWQLGQEEELMLLVQKRGGTDALEDQLTFNNFTADSAIVKPSKTMAKAGHHLMLSLRHCRPFTLAVNLRAEREQRRREQQAILEQERRRRERQAILDRSVEQRMCPRCGMGPVVNFECSNLGSHNEGRGLFSNGTNACPACNFFSRNWQDWAEWDEQRSTQLRNGYRGGLSISRNFG